MAVRLIPGAGEHAAMPELDPTPNVFAQAVPATPEDVFPRDDPMAVAVTLAPGKILYAQGEAVPSFYLIRSGHVKLSRTSSGGNSLISDLLAAGSLFGPGMTTARRATHTATAKGKVCLSRYPHTLLRGVVPGRPPVAAFAVNQMADRLQGAERRLQAMLELDVSGRVALALRDLAVEAGRHCVHGYEVDVPITQQELADLVGASRSAVSLELNAMRRRGWLSYTRRFICLDQPEALLERAREAMLGVS